jgi:hypothetical protein
MAKPVKPAVKKITTKRAAVSKPAEKPVSELARRRRLFAAMTDDDRDEMMQEICNNLATSERSLVSILKANHDYPNVTLFWEWLDSNKSFASNYARALSLRADFMADAVMDISDNGANDFTTGRNGEMVLDAEHVQRSKLRVDTRKWLMSKFKPKVYGDRQILAGDPDAPLTGNKPDLSNLSNEELKMYIALQSKVEKKK